MHKQVRKAVIILFWLAVWQFAAVWADNRILLVGPAAVLRSFVQNAVSPGFVRTILCSLSRIGLGFFLALFCGLMFGVVSCRFHIVQEALAPVIHTLKSIPVASFVVLLLIWFGSGRLSFFISFLIVFPNVYVNTVAGLKSADARLLEMARVYGIGRWNRFFYIYREALMPYLKSCFQISLGMSWKSGVAAEVIGLPEHSLGERLYMSKIYLDTAGLFAWTLTIVIVSFVFEKTVLWLTGLVNRWKPYPWTYAGGRSCSERRKTEENRVKERIVISDITKSYAGMPVLHGCNITLEKGGRYLLMAPSGAGKTTLLRILTGLDNADKGTVSGMPERVSVVFQEDRLCEEYDTVCNIMLGMSACGKNENRESVIEAVRRQASHILPADSLTKPVKELSGGMKRRAALLRAVMADSDMLILDEPFSGLDGENRIRCAAYILEHLRGRTLLVTTHQEEDVELLCGTRVELR